MKLFGRTKRQARERGQQRAIRIAVEICEQRVLLASPSTEQFLVTTTANSGAGSLEQAIDDANAWGATTAGNNSIIDFDIPGPGPFVITPTAPLPAIAFPTLIDGTTQPLPSGAPYAGAPLVQIDGSQAGTGDGLQLAPGSDGSVVRGLDIYAFANGAAIYVDSNTDAVYNNYLGTDVTGSSTTSGKQSLGNFYGVYAVGGTGATIGGVGGSGNVISGNSVGVELGASASSAVVESNLIGTNAAGAGDLPNTTAGVQIYGFFNLVGATTAGAGNVIANNPIGVDVEDGIGNGVRGNSLFANGQAILLNASNGANNDQQAPTLTGATSFNGTTTVAGKLVSTPANPAFDSNANYFVDFYASTASDPPLPGQAHIFLGSELVTTDSTGNASFTFTASVGVPIGQTITATATDVVNNTSELSSAVNSATVASSLVVTTTADSGPGSLREAITAADQLAGSVTPIGITFAIPASDETSSSSPQFVIDLQSPLPSIDVPVTIDGRTETAFLGNPVATSGPAIAIDGSGLSSGSDGLVLATGSGGVSGGTGTSVGGSTIDDLMFTQFTGDAVQVQSSNNTIGGDFPGTGNVFTDNSGNAVHVTGSASGNAIRQNLIYGNTGGAIVLDSGTNDSQPAPTVTAVASIAGLTTIDGQLLNLTAGQTYAVDFFASGSLGGPAQVFLGSVAYTPTQSGSQGFTASFTAANAAPDFDVSAGLSAGQVVTATVTGPGNSTSAVAVVTATVPVTVPQAFVVTNTSDVPPESSTAMGVGSGIGTDWGSAVGSLRLAIIEANLLPPASGVDDITFDIASTPLVIAVHSALPAITVPDTIDGTTEPGVALDGNGGSFDGLTLGAGSSGSTIEGLTILNFGGNGIVVLTPSNPSNPTNDTIGGTTAAAADVIDSNGRAGILLQSAGNVVEGDFIGTNAQGASLGNNFGVQIFGGSDNTIGGSVLGAGNTIGDNHQAGVSVLTGTGNVIRGNTYAGSNGPNAAPPPPLEANDIVVSSTANGGNNPPTPQLLGAVYFAGTGSVTASVQFLFSSAIPTTGYAVDLDFYLIDSSPAQRVYLGSAAATVVRTTIGTNQALSQTINASVTVPAGVGNGSVLAVTATFASSPAFTSTTPFSNETTATTPLVVNTTADNGDNAHAIEGSLRQAINYANANPGSTISFDVPATDLNYNNVTNTFTLTPLIVNGSTIDLPTITAPVTIDGATEPNPAPPGSSGKVPPVVVELAGNHTVLSAGLTLGAGSGGSTIEGLTILGFNDGIDVLSSDNTIGGAAAAAADVIGSNTGAGVMLASTADSNTVEGDDIGGSAGPNDLANAYGVEIAGSTGNTIGGTALNTIAFNTSAGIFVSGGGQNVIQGNDIGTDSAADHLGNAIGIAISGSTGNTIGGPASAQVNVIAASNGSTTVTGGGAGVALISGATGNLLEGNYIGTDPAADDLGNEIGVEINGSTGNTIGGAGVGLGNVIAANGGVSATNGVGDGILLLNAAAANLVEGNTIGTYTTQAGASSASNQGAGIEIDSGFSNTIGGAAITTGSPLAGQSVMTLGAAANSIVGNGADGVYLFGAGSAGQPANTVTGNWIARNKYNGVDLSADLTGGVAVAAITDNLIGTSQDGTATADANGLTYGNGLSGVLLEQTSNGASTGTTAVTVSGNVISANGLSGVTVQAAPSIVSPNFYAQANITIAGNIIGLDKTGTTPETILPSGAAYPNGNALDGVLIDNVGGVTIGALGPGVPAAPLASTNVISGNSGRGVEVRQNNFSVREASSVPPLLGDTIAGNYIGTDASGADAYYAPATSSALYTLGNLSDGVFLYDPVVATVDDNLISNNRAAGVHAAQVAVSPGSGTATATTVTLTIQGNDIGTNAAGSTVYQVVPVTSTSVAGVTTATQDLYSLGNGSDGIFLDSVVGTTAQAVRVSGNVVSGNRADGIDALQAGGLTISGNTIGIDQAGDTADQRVTTTTTPAGGTPVTTFSYRTLGNGSDGIFLDEAATSGNPVISVTQNTISANGANGVDLLQSNDVSISGNWIGVSATGTGNPGMPPSDFGNGGNGVFLNQSSSDTVGGTTSASANIIAGNDNSGIYVSGSSATPVQDDVILGNDIGLSPTQKTPRIQNAVAGVVLSNANDNTVGGSASGAGNVISGNSLDGILLVNTAESNVIESNVIGTNANKSIAIPNSADGIFLLGAPATIHGVVISQTPSAVSNNNIVNNTIAGNGENGIQIFGDGATANAVTGNTIGMAGGLGNGGNGVYLNDDGGSQIVQNNTVVANAQSGVLVLGIDGKGGGETISGNYVGTDANGTGGEGNGGNGVSILGASDNTVRGNVVSGNLQGGVVILSSAGSSPADHNLVTGNTIGVAPGGAAPLRNQADGVDILSGSDNTIGGTAAGAGNMISANGGNGVVIDPSANGVPANDNWIMGNMIGVNGTASTVFGNTLDGILVLGGTGNVIGTATGSTVSKTNVPSTPSNVISGNGQDGVVITYGSFEAPNFNTVEGNYIGVNMAGTAALPNGLNGVAIGSGMQNSIGGTAAGAGNVISGNGTNGVVIAQVASVAAAGTPNNNVVLGNIIGLDSTGTTAIKNALDGVLVAGGTGNMIGGAGSALTVNSAPTYATNTPSNVIAANGQWGVELSGVSSGDVVQGNYLGVGRDGTTAQPNGFGGVLINAGVTQSNLSAPGDMIGGPAPGDGNIIDGNRQGYGVEIIGPASGAAGNQVDGNLIGINAAGDAAGNGVGVALVNSSNNTVGGAVIDNLGQGNNVISANAIAGIELTGTSANNQIQGNYIGTDATGTKFYYQFSNATVGNPNAPPTPVAQPVVATDPSLTNPNHQSPYPAQQFGVWIDTSSYAGNSSFNNQVVRNVISGNFMGVNILGGPSSSASGGSTAAVPIGRNLVAGNFIGTDHTGSSPDPNFQYGVYVENSAYNTIGGTSAATTNSIAANGVAGVFVFGGAGQANASSAPSASTAAYNVIEGNQIGSDSSPFQAKGVTVNVNADPPQPENPYLVPLGQQQHGVVILASSGNTIGGTTAGAGNTISGNEVTGVLITRQDFNGVLYSTPSNNAVYENAVENNKQFGVYLYESPNNTVPQPPARYFNTLSGNGINYVDYVAGEGGGTAATASTSTSSKASTTVKIPTKPKKEPKPTKTKAVVGGPLHKQVSAPHRSQTAASLRGRAKKG